MYDDGTQGDETPQDGTYSLNIKLTIQEPGKKILKAKVIDRIGWEGGKEAMNEG